MLGYLLKDRIAGLEEMTDALERIQTGGVVLDPEVDSTAFSKPRAYPLAALMLRELVVLWSDGWGRTNAGIAQTLFRSAGTAEKNISVIVAKWTLPRKDVRSRATAVAARLKA